TRSPESGWWASAPADVARNIDANLFGTTRSGGEHCTPMHNPILRPWNESRVTAPSGRRQRTAALQDLVEQSSGPGNPESIRQARVASLLILAVALLFHFTEINSHADTLPVRALHVGVPAKRD